MPEIKYHVARNGQQIGPVTLEQIREMIRTGQIAPQDAMWHEGLAAWQPAQIVLGSAAFTPGQAEALNYGEPGAQPLPPLLPVKSWMGLTSVIISGVMFIGWFVLLAAAGIASSQGASETSPQMIVIGLLLFAGIGINLVGAAFGLIPLIQPGHKKTLAAVGLSINALELVGIAALMLVGTAMQ